MSRLACKPRWSARAVLNAACVERNTRCSKRHPLLEFVEQRKPWSFANRLIFECLALQVQCAEAQIIAPLPPQLGALQVLTSC
eukprot:6206899-Amphidinium_carterae.1